MNFRIRVSRISELLPAEAHCSSHTSERWRKILSGAASSHSHRLFSPRPRPLPFSTGNLFFEDSLNKIREASVLLFRKYYQLTLETLFDFERYCCVLHGVRR